MGDGVIENKSTSTKEQTFKKRVKTKTILSHEFFFFFFNCLKKYFRFSTFNGHEILVRTLNKDKRCQSAIFILLHCLKQ